MNTAQSGLERAIFVTTRQIQNLERWLATPDVHPRERNEVAENLEQCKANLASVTKSDETFMLRLGKPLTDPSKPREE